MRGLDEARLMRIVTEGLAELADGALQHRVAHEHVGPDGAEQFLLRHEPAGLPGEELEQRKGLWRQRDTLVFPIQMARDRIQPEFGKRQDAIGAHCGGKANLTESSPIAHRIGTDFPGIHSV